MQGTTTPKRDLLQQGSNELGQMQVPFGQFVSWQRFFYRGLFFGTVNHWVSLKKGLILGVYLLEAFFERFFRRFGAWEVP